MSLVTRIYRPTPGNLRRLAGELRRGGLVAVPSETVYGLAADALNAEACEGIFRAKGRPASDPLIVHVASVEEAGRVAEVSPEAERLARAFWPGPLTLVLKKKPVVPEGVTAGLGTVAVRMPNHRWFLELIRLAGCPLAAPSANPFGYISPTCARHVKEGLGGKVGSILDGGSCEVGLESTIVDMSREERPVILRPGAISAEQMAAVLGRVVEQKEHVVVAREVAAPAPGMLARHYSPRTPLSLHEALSEEALGRLPAGEAGLLRRRPAGGGVGMPHVFWLSEGGELEEVARSLFERLRELDGGQWRRVHVETMRENTGLGLAINDRLRRAAARD